MDRKAEDFSAGNQQHAQESQQNCLSTRPSSALIISHNKDIKHSRNKSICVKLLGKII